jgi:hypothetical protein
MPSRFWTPLDTIFVAFDGLCRNTIRTKSSRTGLTGKKTGGEAVRKHLGFSFCAPLLDKGKTQHIGVVKFGIAAVGHERRVGRLQTYRRILALYRKPNANGSRPKLTEMMA